MRELRILKNFRLFRKHKIDAMKLVPSHFEALKTVQNFEDIIPGKRLVLQAKLVHGNL